MKEISVSEQFVIGAAKTEWVSIKIHGQSFMLHQIRKMISMATLITRCGCPVDRIGKAYARQKINIPKAPALGLLLESPVFEGYNKQLEKFGYNPIDFSKFQSDMDAFKMKHIYDKIYREEVDENVFNAFFSYIDSFNMVTGAQGIETEEKVGSAVQKSIFEFLTARGIPDYIETDADREESKRAKKQKSKKSDFKSTTNEKSETTDEQSETAEKSPEKKSSFSCTIQ